MLRTRTAVWGDESDSLSGVAPLIVRSGCRALNDLLEKFHQQQAPVRKGQGSVGGGDRPPPPPQDVITRGFRSPAVVSPAIASLSPQKNSPRGEEHQQRERESASQSAVEPADSFVVRVVSTQQEHKWCVLPLQIVEQHSQDGKQQHEESQPAAQQQPVDVGSASGPDPDRPGTTDGGGASAFSGNTSSSSRFSSLNDASPTGGRSNSSSSRFASLSEAASPAASPSSEHQPSVSAEQSALEAMDDDVDFSIPSAVASFLSCNTRDFVFLELVPRSQHVAAVMELTFKDQYVSQADIWFEEEAMRGHCFFQSQRLDRSSAASVRRRIMPHGVRCNVLQMRGPSGRLVPGGIAGPETRFVLRSYTASIVLMVQMSSEMWEFGNDGALHFERVTNLALWEMFRRWKSVDASHRLTIVFFSRVLFGPDSEMRLDPSLVRPDGVRARDFFRVVVDDEQITFADSPDLSSDSCADGEIDWRSAQRRLKTSFNSFRSDLTAAAGEDGVISSAREGNPLEALHLALGLHETDFCNRDLHATGQLHVLLTPGSGVFDVMSPVARALKKRLLQSGTGCDLISLASPPLHAVPLFRFIDRTAGRQFEIPHWIHLSFFSPRKRPSSVEASVAPKIDLPRSLERAPARHGPVVPVYVASPTWDEVYDANQSRSPTSAHTRAGSIDTAVLVAMGLKDASTSSPGQSRSDHFLSISPLDGSPVKATSPNSLNVRESTSSAESLLSEDYAKAGKLSPLFGEDVLVPQSHDRGHTATTWRWGTLQFGRQKEVNPAFRHPNWDSLCAPAMLPLVNSNDQPNLSNFQEGVYSVSIWERVSLAQKANPLLSKRALAELLLRQLVAQRVSHRFQLMSVSGLDEAISRREPRHQQRHQQRSRVFDSNSNSRVFALTLGRVIHRLSLDSTDESIEVKRFTRQGKPVDPESDNSQYPYSMWGAFGSDSFLSCFIDSPFGSLSSGPGAADTFPWNMVDHLVAGVEDAQPLSENLYYNRQRFALLRRSATTSETASSGGQFSRSQVAMMAAPGMSREKLEARLRQQEEEAEAQRRSVAVRQDIQSFQKFCNLMLSQYRQQVEARKMIVYVEQNGQQTNKGANAQLAQQQNWSTSVVEPDHRRTNIPLGNFVRVDLRPTSATSDEKNADDLGSAFGSTGGSEWLVLRYDNIFSNQRHFFVEVDWMAGAARGRLVESFVAQLERRARLCGFELRQVPTFIKGLKDGQHSHCLHALRPSFPIRVPVDFRLDDIDAARTQLATVLAPVEFQPQQSLFGGPRAGPTLFTPWKPIARPQTASLLHKNAMIGFHVSKTPSSVDASLFLNLLPATRPSLREAQGIVDKTADFLSQNWVDGTNDVSPSEEVSVEDYIEGVQDGDDAGPSSFSTFDEQVVSGNGESGDRAGGESAENDSVGSPSLTSSVWRMINSNKRSFIIEIDTSALFRNSPKPSLFALHGSSCKNEWALAPKPEVTVGSTLLWASVGQSSSSGKVEYDIGEGATSPTAPAARLTVSWSIDLLGRRKVKATLAPSADSSLEFPFVVRQVGDVSVDRKPLHEHAHARYEFSTLS